jgi:hypothetical protein
VSKVRLLVALELFTDSVDVLRLELTGEYELVMLEEGIRGSAKYRFGIRWVQSDIILNILSAD